jgi:acyl dehydratase
LTIFYAPVKYPFTDLTAGRQDRLEPTRGEGAGAHMTESATTVGVSSTFPKSMPEEHARLPVWNAENWFYEDWPMGQKIRSLRRTISEGDSHAFNLLVTDIHPYVQDDIFARTEGLFGKRLVAGAFVFSAGLGLVATNCVNAFSYGYDKLRFIKPTFVGDTIYTIRTNLEKRAKYKDLGLIRASYEVFKGEGD